MEVKLNYVGCVKLLLCNFFKNDFVLFKGILLGCFEKICLFIFFGIVGLSSDYV